MALTPADLLLASPIGPEVTSVVSPSGIFTVDPASVVAPCGAKALVMLRIPRP